MNETSNTLIKNFLTRKKLTDYNHVKKSIAIGDIIDLMKQGLWSTEVSFQRSPVNLWNNADHQQKVLKSLITGIGWGTITVNKSSATGKYFVWDGGHRSRFITSVAGGEIPILGESIKDNPDLLNMFKSIIVDIEIYQDLDDEVGAMIFESLNGGADMTVIQRLKGKLNWLIQKKSFVEGVKNLISIWPLRSGNPLKRETSEEIILQAITVNLGYKSLLAAEYVANIQSLQNTDRLNTAVNTVLKNITTLKSYVEGDGKNNTLKAMFKKTHVNILLSLDTFPNWINLSGYYQTGDSSKLDSACRSASGGADSINKRIEVFGSVVSGTYDKDEEKIKKIDEKINKKLQEKKQKKTESKPVKKKTMTELIRDAWDISPESEDMLYITHGINEIQKIGDEFIFGKNKQGLRIMYFTPFSDPTKVKFVQYSKLISIGKTKVK